MIRTGLIVALGGGVGAFVRYAVGVSVERFHGGTFPVGTLVVNTVGCLLIGWLAGGFDERGIGSGHSVRLFLLTGILGGFTTYSAFGYETLVLLRSSPQMAALNVVLQLGLGLGAVALGFYIAHVFGKA